MKLPTLLGSLLLASTGILAAPALSSEERLARRVQARKDRRGNEAAQSQFPIPAPTSAGAAETGNATQYFTNWSGAIIEGAPAGTSYYAVGGSFVVPEPAPPVSGPGTWYGTAWVGIYDSDAILQSGVDWGVTVSSTGAYSYQYNAWWEWYPNGWTDYAVTITAGEEVFIICETSNAVPSTTAVCAIENLATGVTVDQSLTAPGTASLEANSAAWVVEDFSSGGLVPFANFGTVTFNNAVAFAGETSLTPNSGTAVAAAIVANNQVITQTTFPYDTTNVVEVTYI